MQLRAVKLLPNVGPTERITIYWAMCLAVYPPRTARLAGRLLSLQGEFKLQQLEVRMAELWGDRATIPRAVQRIVRSMVQWGVLSDTDHTGVYRSLSPVVVKGDLSALLVEGLLRGRMTEAFTDERVFGHPALFPFEVDVRPYNLRQRPEFEVFRQVVETEFIHLKK